MAGFNNALEVGSIAREKEVSKLKKLMGEIKGIYLQPAFVSGAADAPSAVNTEIAHDTRSSNSVSLSQAKDLEQPVKHQPIHSSHASGRSRDIAW